MVELTADWLDVLLEVGWCGAAAWWWRLEADVELVLLPGGIKLEADADFSQCPNVYSVNIQCQKCSQCHISTFCEFLCNFVQFGSVFPVFALESKSKS